MQLKVANNLTLDSYSQGAKADIEDGVYVGYEDIVVILEGIVQKTLPFKDKWGRDLDHKQFLGRRTKLNYPCCIMIEESFGEEVLELILKEYAPDIEFLGDTLDKLKAFYQESNVSVVNMDLRFIKNMRHVSISKDYSDCRVYTNPATDTIFQVSFSVV